MTQAAQTSLRQLNNTVELVGLLKSKNLETKPTTKDGVTKKYISGTIVVEVKGENKIHNHTVRVFFMEGSKLYKGIETVNREYKDKDTFGEEFADLIKVTGELQVNDYYNREDQLTTTNQIKGVFFNRLEQPTPHKANASIECIVENFVPDTNKEGILNGNLKVNLFTVGYGNKVSPLQKVFIGQGLAEAFSSMYQPNSTGRLLLSLNNYAVVEERAAAAVPQHGFGQENNISNTVTQYVNNIEIVGGDVPKFEGGYTAQEIAFAKQVRNLQLQEVKQKAQAPSTPPAPTGFGVPQTGFGGIPTPPPFGGIPTPPAFTPQAAPAFTPPNIGLNADELPDF